MVGPWLGIRLYSKSKYFTMASLFVLGKHRISLTWHLVSPEQSFLEKQSHLQLKGHLQDQSLSAFLETARFIRVHKEML